MSRPFALWAVGRDRPGIVAAVTGALLASGANLEDSQMAILRGRFTMMLIVALPQGSLASLRSELAAVAERLELDAWALSELGEDDTQPAPAPTHLVSVYGADHPGIVHAVSRELAEAGMSITDLQSHLARAADEPGSDPLYVVLLEVAAGSERDALELERRLLEIGAAQGLEVTVRALESDDL